MIRHPELLARLREGNLRYLEAPQNPGDVSPALRRTTANQGQAPYAIVIACSDSRVIPEALFSAGIGERFVIRVAGNVLDNHQLGSIEYAAAHLGCKLILMLGHTGCGAVGAALHGGGEGYVSYLTDEILRAIGRERDPDTMRSGSRPAELLRQTERRTEKSPALYGNSDGQRLCVIAIITDSRRKVNTKHQKGYVLWNM